MREYTEEKIVQKTRILKKIICNGCGKELSVEGDVVSADYLSVEKTWGYFSSKDCERHSFALCEDCYDRLVKGFALPVTVEQNTELL